MTAEVITTPEEIADELFNKLNVDRSVVAAAIYDAEKRGREEMRQTLLDLLAAPPPPLPPSEAPNFGKRLADYRKQRGLSLTDVANLSGVARSYVHAVERGHSSPTLDLARRLAEAVSVPLTEMVR